MSLRKGPFRVYCDAKDCDAFVDLDTDDFEEAKELREDAGESGWTHFSGFSGWKDTCPIHTRADC